MVPELQNPSPIYLQSGPVFRSRGEHSISLPHSVDLNPYMGRMQMEVNSERHLLESKSQPWSVANYDSDLPLTGNICIHPYTIRKGSSRFESSD